MPVPSSTHKGWFEDRENSRLEMYYGSGGASDPVKAFDFNGTTLNFATAQVWNDDSADVDFRWEGSTNANLMFMDGGQDAISLGGANVDGSALIFNNLTDRTAVTSVGMQTHMPIQTQNFDNVSGTIAIGASVYFGIPTWTNDNATLTITDTATVYIEGAPVDSTNVTATDGANAKALWVDGGLVRFDAGLDMNSAGSIINVGAAGNDWTANALTLDSSNSAATNLLTVKNSESSNGGSDAQIDVISGGASGGDPAVRFDIDGAGTITMGLDNSDTDNFVFSNNDALGTSNQITFVIATGVMSVNGDGGGADDPVLLFDDYDDAKEIKRFAHSALNAMDYGTTLAQRDANRERMVELGVAEWGFGTTTGVRDRWMMKVQPMFRLLAGGIYQNQEHLNDFMDSMSEKVDYIANRLSGVEQSVKGLTP